MATGARAYRNLSHAFVTIVSKEGILAIQKGLLPGIAFQTFFNGIRIGLFDHVKVLVHSDSAPFASKILAGAGTGCLAAGAASPLYMVKCRLQTRITGTATVAVGTQHGYQGMIDGLFSILRSEGVRGLYRGVDGFILRTAVGSAFQLSVFDAAKGPCQEGLGNWTGTLAASGLAGLVAVTAMNPFDVVCTRLYNQSRLSDGTGCSYSGPLDCFGKSLRAEGPAVLVKGWVAHAGRTVPHTVYSLLFYEQLRRLAERHFC